MRVAKVHWSSSADVLPECNPHGPDLREATTDARKVTCKPCLAYMAKRGVPRTGYWDSPEFVAAGARMKST
jgi:hypothetical protein